MLSTLLVSDIPVGWMGGKEFSFAVQSCSHGLLRINILLTPIHHADEPEPKRVCASGQDVIGVGSCIHEIEFC